MKLSLFNFELPKPLIAQHPERRRDQSRLMILDRRTGSLTHGAFGQISQYLKPGDALVVNNTKVFKARLLGRRATGGKAEIFLVRKLDTDTGEIWEALAQPSRRLSEGEKIVFDDRYRVTLEAWLGRGRWRVAFSSRTARERIIAKFGHVPLPQYISRRDEPTDIRRYQTVFANPERVGAVAAPTAGFHFTRPLLERLKAQGVCVCEITLHVGPGTFKPIKAEEIEEHSVDPELAELSPQVAATLNEVRSNGGQVWAVGTTSVRTLESAQIISGAIQPLREMVDLYIKPGHRFEVVDHMITNFHLPKSSLLVLVSAFATREAIIKAYHEAIAQEYRFYSYGDAMLIL